jgi:glutamyl-tRNA synthetase
MTVITRFAPSPTGYLHIGGARTALFNYLFAKNTGGKFLLRIEDTDKERSTDAAKEAIITSLKWLDINWDDEIIYQSERVARHKEVALELLNKGKAYYCFSSQEEIAALREAALAKKEPFIFKSPWRDADPATYPTDTKPVIRIKVPHAGETIVHDKLQGDVIVQNAHIDDMVLLRGDGTPTYMLAVVVDDHDMQVTHIIRGDDHLTNASRQQIIYEAMGWDIPVMVHIPLIHGPDGAKLSKRHGALGADQYKEMGYLPEALCNYLLRLGWSHGDDEYISREQAIEWFNIEHLGKSPSRLDFDKMRNMNAHYIRQLSDDEITAIIAAGIPNLSDKSLANIKLAINEIKPRAELIVDLVNLANLYLDHAKINISKDAEEIIAGCDNALIKAVINTLENITDYSSNIIQEAFSNLAKEKGLKLGEIMKYVRALVAGCKDSPSMFHMLAIIGKDEALRRVSSL